MYFPEGALDDFCVGWYSKHLKAMREPSLLPSDEEEGRHAYRFTWLRTFHRPVTVRIELGTEEHIVITKVTDGQGGYEPGKLVRDEQALLSTEQVESLRSVIADLDLRHLPTGRGGGIDGAEWIVEARRGGDYHLTTQWSPREGAVRRLGLAFLDVGNVHDEVIY
jgi:hypothetical protein